MPYTVSRGGTIDGQRPGPVAPTVDLNLKQALHRACSLLAEGQPNVSIIDGKGNQISGDDLVACCKNEKTLTADLRPA